VHDGIGFERLGIPSAVIITAPFIPTADAIAALDGLPSYECVVVPHPVTSLDEAQLADRAVRAAAQVEALLLGLQAPGRATGGPDLQVTPSAVQEVVAPYRDGLRTDGADLIVEQVSRSGVAVRLTFSDEACMACVLPAAAIQRVLEHALTQGLGGHVPVQVVDPREPG